MLGPCWDHIWPSFTSRPARVMKISKVSHDRLRHMCMKCSLLKIMLRPCFDHVKTMFSLSLAPYQLELWHFFKTFSIWSKKKILGVYDFGPFQCHILTMLKHYFAWHYFQMVWSSESIKTKSIRLKANVCGAFNSGVMTGTCMDPIGSIFGLTLHPDQLKL